MTVNADVIIKTIVNNRWYIIDEKLFELL